MNQSYLELLEKECRKRHLKFEGEIDFFAFAGEFQVRFGKQFNTALLKFAYDEFSKRKASAHKWSMNMLFSQPHTPKSSIIYRGPDVSPNTLTDLKGALPPHVHVTPDKENKPLHMKEIFKTSNFRWFQAQSPRKSVVKLPSSFNENERVTMAFDFKVNLESIVYDTRKKRHTGQNQLMRRSAQSVFLELNEQISKEIRFNWCHIRGLCLGGDQSKENLLPGTQGSNLFTLALFEMQLIQMLEQNPGFEFRVNITIDFFPTLKIPEIIRYEIKWGNGRKAIFSVEPLNVARPTRDDVKTAFALFDKTRTPSQLSLFAGSSSQETKEFKAKKRLGFDEEVSEDQENGAWLNKR